MSYNTHLYFADEEFPRAQWNEVLSLFEFDLIEPQPQLVGACGTRQQSVAEWVVRDNNASFWCSLRSFRSEIKIPFVARWVIATDSRADIIELLGVARLAYAALSHIPNLLFYDLDGHFCRTPEQISEVFIPYLESWIHSSNFNKLFKAGIIDYDGKIIF